MKHSKIQNQSVNKGKYAGNVNTVSQQKSCCYRFFNGCKPGWYDYNAKAHIHKNIPPNPETVCYHPNVMVPEINRYAMRKYISKSSLKIRFYGQESEYTSFM